MNSIITQTYTNLQIIVIDDGSTDGSSVICDDYAMKDSRIQIIHQENRGLSVARNLGIELATGEYLSFVDSDDYLSPDCIETLLRLHLDYNADMSICSCILLEDKKQHPHKHNTSHDDPELFSGSQKIEACLRHHRFPVSAWGKLYSAKLFQEIRYPEGRIYEDSAIFHLLVNAADRIIYTKKPVIHIANVLGALQRVLFPSKTWIFLPLIQNELASQKKTIQPYCIMHMPICFLHVPI